MKSNDKNPYEFIRSIQKPFHIFLVVFVATVIIIQYRVGTDVVDKISHILILVALVVQVIFNLLYRKFRKLYTKDN